MHNIFNRFLPETGTVAPAIYTAVNIGGGKFRDGLKTHLFTQTYTLRRSYAKECTFAVAIVFG